MLSTAETTELRLRCDRSLVGHGPVSPGELLAGIPADVEIDTYGDGGVVAELEREVAALLGKPAAVFLPSGIMAQQSVLRVHADRRGRSTVLYHPTCHLAVHEGGALERVQRLLGRPVGSADALITIDDLEAVAEAPAALLLELPQREIGGQLPAWDDLVVQTGWARDRGAAAHCDGARLWEASAGYGRPPADLAALFDSVYVSFYKGIGALAGCCVAGDEETIAEVREWRKRLGGTLYGLWPAAASALALLRRRLPLMPDYFAHTLAIADALREVEGVTVVPDPPQTPMLHLLLDAPVATIDANIRRIADTEGVWTIRGASPTGDPRTQRTEIGVGDATLAIAPEEVARLLAGLVVPV
jgi:threonine aldolase